MEAARIRGSPGPVVNRQLMSSSVGRSAVGQSPIGRQSLSGGFPRPPRRRRSECARSAIPKVGRAHTSVTARSPAAGGTDGRRFGPRNPFFAELVELVDAEATRQGLRAVLAAGHRNGEKSRLSSTISWSRGSRDCSCCHRVYLLRRSRQRRASFRLWWKAGRVSVPCSIGRIRFG